MSFFCALCLKKNPSDGDTQQRTSRSSTTAEQDPMMNHSPPPTSQRYSQRVSVFSSVFASTDAYNPRAIQPPTGLPTSATNPAIYLNTHYPQTTFYVESSPICRRDSTTQFFMDSLGNNSNLSGSYQQETDEMSDEDFPEYDYPKSYGPPDPCYGDVMTPRHIKDALIPDVYQSLPSLMETSVSSNDLHPMHEESLHTERHLHHSCVHPKV